MNQAFLCIFGLLFFGDVECFEVCVGFVQGIGASCFEGFEKLFGF